MPPKNVSKFGRVALDLGYLNIKQLEECLHLQFEFQKAGKEVPRLGSLLLSKKYINSKQLETILERQKDAKYNKAYESTRNILKLFPAGTYIYHQGNTSLGNLFLIHEGSVDFYRNNELVDTLSGKGKFFGEVAVLTGTNYTESAVVTRDSKIFIIPNNEVNSFLSNRPEMGLKIAKRIAQRFNKLVRATSTTTQPAPAAEKNAASAQPQPSPADLIKLQALKKSQDQQTSDYTPEAAPQDDSPEKDIPEEAIDSSTAAENIISENNNSTANQSEDYPAEIHYVNPDTLENEQNNATDFSTEETEISDMDNLNIGDPDAVINIKPFSTERATEPEIISTAYDCSVLCDQIRNYQSGPFPKEIVTAVKQIVTLFLDIDDIDAERTAFFNTIAEPTEILKTEISRQKSEITRIPPHESLINSLTRIKELVSDKMENPENSPAKAKALDETTSQQEENETVKQKIDKKLKEAYAFSIRQKELLHKRYEILPDVIDICSKYAAAEPLFQTFAKYEINAGEVFGFGIYQMALEEYSNIQNDKIASIRVDIEELGTDLKSLVNRFKINKKNEEEREQQFQELLKQEKKYKLIQTIVRREIATIEKQMVSEFWKIYGKAAILLLTLQPGAEKTMLKAFLRWGLLGYNSKWISPDICCVLLESCAKELTAPFYSTSSNYVYYADEIIELTARGYIPTSPNEDLELNHRNSPEWRCDKSYKRYHYLKLHYYTLLDVLKTQEKEVNEISQKLSEALDRETALLKSHSKSPQHRQTLSGVKQEIQRYKVISTKINNIIDRIHEQMLPQVLEDSDKALNNIESSGVALKVYEIIHHEVKSIRRYSKLVAKLKEPYLPFVLRDNYKTTSDIINNREIVYKQISDAEIKDPLLFNTKLIPTAKRKQRILVRKAPYIMICPSCGILGFVISPRSGIENGRLTLPGYFEKSMISDEVYNSTLADFRFDCSKAEAGVDIMTSDTLVAAYATYRWNMRNKKKEARKKAAVYLDETERNNWRRHYQLYMSSALESGKYLFFRCSELYEVIINNFIDLPESCEKLKK